jgi:hypothetical protein
LFPQSATVCDTANSTEWNEIDAFIRSLRAPTAPVLLNPEAVDSGRLAFIEGRCAGCHGGNNWTVSTQFYEPGPLENGALPYDAPKELVPELGALRTELYSVPNALAHLNPAAAKALVPESGCPGGVDTSCTTYRMFEPASMATADLINAAYDKAVTPNDQIRCALRDVGTFPAQPATGAPDLLGKTPLGAPRILELRQDMSTLAQGSDGMNVPSLLGLSFGAPFFHAGNARTLEELFDKAFVGHHQALVADFLADPDTRNERIVHLVAFLLSIDERTDPVPVPQTDAAGTPLEHDFCRRR